MSSAASDVYKRQGNGHAEEDLKHSVIATGPPGLTWNQVAKLGLSSIEHVETPPFTTVQGVTQDDAFTSTFVKTAWEHPPLQVEWCTPGALQVELMCISNTGDNLNSAFSDMRVIS